jgi:hypothetical protein
MANSSDLQGNKLKKQREGAYGTLLSTQGEQSFMDYQEAHGCTSFYTTFT